MNYTWFASAYDDDSAVFRLLTLLQMVGVLVFATGVPGLFSGDFRVGVLGYVVMRLALVVQWLLAARGDPARRTTCLRYAWGIALVQVGWVARLWLALVDRRWADLFGPLRPLWAEARLWVFGHAALEKLVSPYKSITAHVLPAPAAIKTIEDADTWLAGALSAERLVPKPFVPLPLLGVPGWWPANEDAAFYDDATVFRPPRVRDGVAR